MNEINKVVYTFSGAHDVLSARRQGQRWPASLASLAGGGCALHTPCRPAGKERALMIREGIDLFVNESTL